MSAHSSFSLLQGHAADSCSVFTQPVSPQCQHMGLFCTRFMTLHLHLLNSTMCVCHPVSSACVSVGKWHVRVRWVQLHPNGKTLRGVKILWVTRTDFEEMFLSLVWIAWQYSWGPYCRCINASGSKGEFSTTVYFSRNCRGTVREWVFQAFLSSSCVLCGQ